MTSFTPDQWVIIGLVFVLGFLVGAWATSGGRRKWKARYVAEQDQRRVLEKTHEEREAHWAAREKDWREQDSLRSAAARDRVVERPVVAERRPGDLDGDGIPNRADARPIDGDRY
ncbi:MULTISPECIES: hypothetical protein [Sphingomonas]|uniref:hypothetical protein n=1 Tax=Sphingomonas TaxID=13687 RepID=UPI001269D30B|nr:MULTISPECIES: hypothetical protein [Sphingomonas]